MISSFAKDGATERLRSDSLGTIQLVAAPNRTTAPAETRERSTEFGTTLENTMCQSASCSWRMGRGSHIKIPGKRRVNSIVRGTITFVWSHSSLHLRE